MYRSILIKSAALSALSLALVPNPAWAEPKVAPVVQAYEPASLPAKFSARPEHVPQPFPDDDVEFRGGGANGWVVGSGILASAAAVSAIVSAASHGRFKGADTAAERESARKVRNISGATALGLAGGAGLCLAFAAAF
ncbi:MAG: hypothetical protein AB8H79_09450 [Myxococcota bacterium]